MMILKGGQSRPPWQLGKTSTTLPSSLPLRQQAEALRAAGNRRGAADAYLRYMAAPVADPVLRLVATDLQRGDLKSAEARVRRYLNTTPVDPQALRMLGQVGLRLDSFAPAETVFRMALSLAPAFLPLRFELATTLFLQGKFEEATAEIDILLRAKPNSVGARELKAAILSKLGEYAAAADLFRILLDEKPDNPHLWVQYGSMMKTMRRSDDALEAFRRAAELAPDFGEAWWNIANMKTGALTAGDMETIGTALSTKTTKAADRFTMRFALARALEESGAFEASFATYRQANAERLAALPQPEPSDAVQAVRRTIALLTPQLLAARDGMGDPSDSPIFVLGMPRSGSTLLEQILSAHPAIEGTQELFDAPMLAMRIKRSKGAPYDAYPEALADLTAAELGALGAEYLARTRTNRKTDRPHFIDKQPVNWRYIGLIHLMLPNARIIDMRRDRLECCLSMFRQHFARGATFTYSLDGLAAEYAGYEAMMAHMDSVAPGRIKRVELAGLKADLEGVVRDVLDHLGLPFAPECLRFFESDRAVFTPSAEQVRRPINGDSAEVFRRFVPYLGDMQVALEAADATYATRGVVALPAGTSLI